MDRCIEVGSARVTDEIEWLKEDQSWVGLKSINAMTVNRKAKKK